MWIEAKYLLNIEHELNMNQELKAKRLGRFSTSRLISCKMVWFNIPHTMRTHPVIRVEHTRPVIRQPSDVRNNTLKKNFDILQNFGDNTIEVQEIIQQKLNGPSTAKLLYKTERIFKTHNGKQPRTSLNLTEQSHRLFTLILFAIGYCNICID